MSLCISVERKYANKLIELLRQMNIIDKDKKIINIRDKVLIPVHYVPNDVVQSYGLAIEECVAQPKEKTYIKIPSLDMLGDVVIIRANVLDNIDSDELVRNVLSVYPKVRAIFIKRGTVGEYRIPMLELLWGDPVKEIMIKEYGFIFKVRLGDVYFNPRLSEEHHRVASMVRNGEVVADLFAGIGGFSIHVAEKPSLVIANDINPAAYDLLVENIRLNRKRLKGAIIPLNLDTRNIDQALCEGLRVDRIIANLPTHSLSFREVYESILKPGGILHLYLLSNNLDSALRDVTRIFENWGIMGVKRVLDHAPYSYVIRVDLVKPK